MYQDFFDDQRDEIIDKIYAETVSWFAKNKDRPLAEVFYLYLQQARSGSLQSDYARLLDSSMECLTGILPQLTNRLSPGVANVLSLSHLKSRRIFSMLIYWLTQHYSGTPQALPEKAEALDIITGIIDNQALKLW